MNSVALGTIIVYFSKGVTLAVIQTEDTLWPNFYSPIDFTFLLEPVKNIEMTSKEPTASRSFAPGSGLKSLVRFIDGKHFSAVNFNASSGVLIFFGCS